MGLLAPVFSSSNLCPSDLNDLMAALTKESDEKYSATHSAYNGKSAIQFHCFLLALFIAYKKALKERNEVHKAEGEILKAEVEKLGTSNEQAMQAALEKIQGDVELMAKKRKSQKLIWEYGRIIWTVTSSRMFDDHLQSLQGSFVSVRPGQEGAYTWLFERIGLEDEKPGGLRFAVKSKENSDEGEDEGHAEDVEEQQRRDIALMTPDVDPLAQFKSWTRIISSYFVALRWVTSAAKGNSRPFKARFIVTKRCSSPVPVQFNWHDTICSLCSRDGASVAQPVENTSAAGLDPTTDNISLQPTSSSEISKSGAGAPYFTAAQADAAIKLLQDRIDRDREMLTAFGTNSASSESGSSTTDEKKKKKAPLAPGMAVWTGLEHCEGIAGALFTYLHRALHEDQQELYNLILVRTMSCFYSFILADGGVVV